MRVLELPDRLRDREVPIKVVAGFETRGIEFPGRPDGCIRHWTATAGSALKAVTFGRTSPTRLDGPLSQTNQSREVDPRTGLDVVYVVASGKANHAGEGEWNGMSGNYELLGHEIDWAGPTEVFGPMRKLTSELVMRALLDCCTGTNPNDVCEHREYAPKRKIDTNLSGDELRRRMAELANGGSIPGRLDLTVEQYKEIMAELKYIKDVLKDNGNYSVYWHTHWTREMAAELLNRVPVPDSKPDSLPEG